MADITDSGQETYGEVSSEPPKLQEVIERIGLGWGQARAALVGGGVFLADGAEMLLIGSITMSVSDEWGLGPLMRSSVVAAVFVGVMLGNFASGPFGDWLGRRELILASYAATFVFSLASAMATNVAQLAIMRLFVGASFGFGGPAWLSLSTEISPSKWRVGMNIVGQSLFVVGEVYSCVLLMSDSPDLKSLHWRRLVCLGAIPSAVLFVLAFFLLPQSPSYLALHGRYDQAHEVLANLSRLNSQSGSVHFKAEHQPSEEAFLLQDVSRHHAVVFGARLWQSTMVMMYTCFVLNFVYYGGLYAFSQVLPGLATGQSTATELLAGALWELPGFAIAGLVGNLVDRKPCMKISLVLTLVSVLCFLIGASSPVLSTSMGMRAVLHMGYYGMKCFVNMGFVFTYQYLTEIYPTEARVTGSSISIGVGRLAGMLSPPGFEVLRAATGSFTTYFIILAIMVAANALLIDLLPLETAGKLLQDREEAEAVAYGTIPRSGA